jgi:hypothetical protein
LARGPIVGAAAAQPGHGGSRTRVTSARRDVRERL